MYTTEQITKGTVLAGRYRVVRRIGAGGMATVFLATDERLERPVAVKRLQTDAPEASLIRFEREARLGAALNHPNLVTVYDTAATEEGALIVMEYVPGYSLADLAARGALRAERALPILRSVAEALDHAHTQDVVHRDVKPANVLLRDDGVVKLADLGIARAIGATQLTSEGSVIGTLAYMAPERTRGPGAGGPESDVYALAAVAYELLSGEPPRDTVSTDWDEQRPPDLRSGWPAAPGRAPEVLARGLDPDPERRQTTATRLVEELGESITARTPVTETRPIPTRTGGSFEPPPTARTQRTPKAGGGRRRAFAITALCAAVLTAGAIVFAVSESGDDPVKRGSGSGSAGGQQTDSAQADSAESPAPAPEPEAPDGAALNDEGFTLIERGEFEAAIPVLEEAVAVLEDSGDEATYNDALFNLGTALLGAGRPLEAIPLLEKRLAFPDEISEVERALSEALGATGSDSGGGGLFGGEG